MDRLVTVLSDINQIAYSFIITALSYLPNNLQTITITHGYLMKDTMQFCTSDKNGLMQGEEQTILNALKP